MNRSLEALAIFTICLGGILAVVRCSTTERSAAEPSVAERPNSVPAKNSGSAAEQATPINCELAYYAGCGLDRNDGQIYAPLSPLLSSREIALRAIRSQPIPLVILPEGANELVALTGYDAAYDIAMGNELPSPDESPAELTRSQIEAEYAAAELAAAAGAATGTFTGTTFPTELTPPSRTWELISGSLAAVRSDIVSGSQHLQRSYVDPIARGVENHLLRMPLPTLTHPRTQEGGRAQLLYRQRASVESSQSVTWDDYLAFVVRKLPVEPSEELEPRVARQKSPRNVLWPR